MEANSCNVSHEIGTKIIDSLENKNILENCFKKSNQSTTLATKSSIKVDGDSIHVDSQLLFQCLTAAADRLIDDQTDIFSFELCSILSSHLVF